MDNTGGGSYVSDQCRELSLDISSTGYSQSQLAPAHNGEMKEKKRGIGRVVIGANSHSTGGKMTVPFARPGPLSRGAPKTISAHLIKRGSTEQQASDIDTTTTVIRHVDGGNSAPEVDMNRVM
jgi:hypothetical protein